MRIENFRLIRISEIITIIDSIDKQRGLLLMRRWREKKEKKRKKNNFLILFLFKFDKNTIELKIIHHKQ